MSEPLPSHLTFEHDLKVITATFAIGLQNPPTNFPNYILYKMLIPYDSIKAIYVDFSQTGIDNIYMELKAVPKLYEAVPLEGTTWVKAEGGEWVRTLGWTADAQKKGIGCSVEAYSQSPCLQFSFERSEENYSVSQCCMLSLII